MYALLAACHHIAPARLDEQVQSILKDKYAEQMNRMARPDESAAVFEEIFQFASPKFISPVVPSFDVMDLKDTSRDMTKLQLRMFLIEMERHRSIPAVRTYLRLYTSMALRKLGRLMGEEGSDADVRQRVRSYVMASKVHTRQKRWTGHHQQNIAVQGDNNVEQTDSLIDGQYAVIGEVDFTLSEVSHFFLPSPSFFF